MPPFASIPNLMIDLAWLHSLCAGCTSAPTSGNGDHEQRCSYTMRDPRPASASSVIRRERKSRDVGGGRGSVQAETSRRRSERRYNSCVAHPDVILHHLITSLNGPGQEFEGYVGKLDLDKVEP